VIYYNAYYWTRVIFIHRTTFVSLFVVLFLDSTAGNALAGLMGFSADS